MVNDLTVIIMAGGLGKRMNSELPKVLHKLHHQPMLVMIINKALKLEPNKILIVVGKYKDIIEKTINEYISSDKIEYVIQKEALGTGHAIQCCRDHLLEIELDLMTPHTEEGNVLILSGDVPLISTLTIIAMISKMSKYKSRVSLITTDLENPAGYGRVIEKNNCFEKIVEEKDCTQEERLVKKINSGIYLIDRTLLCKYLPYINNNNAQKEFYLTDIIEIIKNEAKIPILLYPIPKFKQYEIIGVNTKEQLLELSKIYRENM